METQKSFIGGDRYQFDFNLCTSAKGWAQINSSEDASYYGHWCNPFELKIICFAEGDLIIETCETEAEFCEQIEKTVTWLTEYYDYGKIDAVGKVKDKLKELNLERFFHGKEENQ